EGTDLPAAGPDRYPIPSARDRSLAHRAHRARAGERRSVAAWPRARSARAITRDDGSGGERRGLRARGGGGTALPDASSRRGRARPGNRALAIGPATRVLALELGFLGGSL